MKLIKNGFQLGNSSNIQHSSNTSSNMSFGFNNSTTAGSKKSNNLISPEISTSSVSRLASAGSKSTDPNEQLSAILKKITQSEGSPSKEALRELYEFKRSHPDIDINKYFKNSSGTLQAYIQEKMKQFESGSETSGTSSSSSNFSRINNMLEELKSNSGNSRNVDDIMKTIADWKSKTHLNKLDGDEDDNDENNIRSNGGTFNNYGSNKYSSATSNRLLSQYQTNGNIAKFTMMNNVNGGVENSSDRALDKMDSSEGQIKAEKYLDFVKDLKKKYTRSYTDVIIFYSLI
jgi:hypothetical protein